MSKHGTMDNLKHLGLCWCLAFASFAALADFTESDSHRLSGIDQNLTDIEVLLESVRHNTYTQLDSIWGHVADISSDTDDAAYDLAIIKENVHSIRYQGLRNITNLLADINSKLVVSSVSSFTSNSNQSIDSVNVHDVRNDDIYWKLGDLQESINNLTNYFSISDTKPYFAVGNLAYYGSTYLNDMATTAKLTVLFRTVFGRDPTSSELTRFKNYMQNYGFNLSFIQQYLGAFPNLPIFEQYNGFYDTTHTLAYRYDLADKAYDSMVAPYATGTVRDFGQMQYLAYGTRDLTDTTIGISNLVAQTISNIFSSVQGDYSGARQLEESLQRPVVYDGDDGKVKNDSGIVTAVVNLADDFCETIPGVNTNNIAEVNTNEIVNISDAGYQNKLNQISTDHITDNSTVLELQQAVDSINIQFVSFIPHVADTDELVLDFGTVSLFGVSKALVFTFQRLPALYWTIQRFLFAFLKALMVFLAIHAIYHHIAVESPL